MIELCTKAPLDVPAAMNVAEIERKVFSQELSNY